MGNSALAQLSTTAGSNVTVGGVSIAENCAMANLNNGARAIIAADVGALTFPASASTDSGLTYSATLTPTIDAYTNDFLYCVKFSTASTTSTPSLNLNAIGAKTMTREDGSTMTPGDLHGYHMIAYDGTNLRVLNPIKPPSGSIAQVASTVTGSSSTGTTQIPNDNTIPQNTEGDQYMTLAITPTNASSKLLINAVWNGSNDTAVGMAVALFQDSTANALAVCANTVAGAGEVISVPLTYSMTASTTSSTTFKIRAGGLSSGTTNFNGSGGNRLFGGAYASSITITEVLP